MGQGANTPLSTSNTDQQVKPTTAGDIGDPDNTTVLWNNNSSEPKALPKELADALGANTSGVDYLPKEPSQDMHPFVGSGNASQEMPEPPLPDPPFPLPASDAANTQPDPIVNVSNIPGGTPAQAEQNQQLLKKQAEKWDHDNAINNRTKGYGPPTLLHQKLTKTRNLFDFIIVPSPWC